MQVTTISPCKHDMLLWPAQTEPSAKLWLWESAWSPSVRMVIKHGHWNSTNGGFSGKHITFVKMLDILLPCLIEGTIELDCTVPICSSRLVILWAGRRDQGPELIASCWIDAVFTLRICSAFCTMPHVQGRPMSFPSTAPANGWWWSPDGHFMTPISTMEGEIPKHRWLLTPAPLECGSTIEFYQCVVEPLIKNPQNCHKCGLKIIPKGSKSLWNLWVESCEFHT